MSTPAFLQGILGHERGLFRNVVSAVLEEGQGHRPDPKARSSQELIEHLIGHGQDLVELLDDGVIHHRNQMPFERVEDAVVTLDETLGGVIDRLGSMDEETWMSPAKFMAGEHLIMEAPRMQLAWTSWTLCTTVGSSARICGRWAAQCRLSTARPPTTRGKRTSC
jgi:hypothetical protein